MLHNLTSQTTELDSMFDDFVRDALDILLPATVIVVWVWVSYVLLWDPPRLTHGFSALVILFASGLGVFHLKQRNLWLAVASYLLGLTSMLTLATVGYHTSASLFLYLALIPVSATLTSPRWMWIVAAGLAMLMVWIGLRYEMGLAQILLPLMLLLITALATWLSSRRLSTALHWSLTATEQSRLSAEDARSHRSELQRALQSLDIALSRLERANRALAFAQEAADKAYRFKSDFVANVSHELRTPLNLIVGFSEMMTTAPESYGGVPLPKEYRGDMLATYRSARHLLDLINDVLDLSQIESGRMAILKERANLYNVVNEAAEIVRGLAEARKLELIVNLPASVTWLEIDRIRVRQVLLNLLTNAMRYTQRGWVRIDAVYSDAMQNDAGPNAQEVTISVADSGRGIAPEKLHRAFEVFDRLDEEQLREGSGLGLAISKKFVELHDGKMSIQSEVDKGTTVSFTLPLPTANPRPVLGRLHMAQRLHYESSRPHVLVLHDDNRALDLLRRHVADCDFDLVHTIDQAIGVLHHPLPDLVLVDSSCCTQWQAVAQQSVAAAHIPVLTCPLPSTRHFGTLIGASDYLPKPVSREDLAGALLRLPATPRTVLVIDDDPHVVRLIARILKSITPDLQVLEAFGGEEGLKVVRSQRPDVIFVDLGMPGMNGRALIQAVRADPALAATPIIVVSVRSVAEETALLMGEIRLARQSGFSLSELLSLLQATLSTITRADAVSPANIAARLAVGLE